jgi:N-acetylmuramoyl-L-alanine amidase
VDVGHGGYDFGASGHFGILEKQICLSIAARVKASLERAAKMADFGLQVRLSRESDHFISLRDRARVANEWGADLFLSIHANSSPVARARGFEVYFLSNEATDAEATRVAKQENAEATTGLSSGVLSILSDLQTNVHILESSQFAEVVYTALSERLRANGRGVRQAPFSVLSGTQMPALLIEVGYLTNEEETRLLMASSYQRRVASALAKGVLDFALRQRRFSRTGSAALGKKRTT